jgi:hypothetical protein
MAMYLGLVLSEDAVKALDEILSSEEAKIAEVRKLPTMSDYRNKWTDGIELVRTVLDTAIADEASRQKWAMDHQRGQGS